MIEPYVGALPLRFRMLPSEIADCIGAPVAVIPDTRGIRIEKRHNLMLGYALDDGALFEAVFRPGSDLRFQGVNLFETAEPISYLRRFDPAPVECFVSILFLNLGIGLSGFHDQDESRKAISVVRRGYWNEYAEYFVPFSE